MCGRYARRADKQRIAEAMSAGVPAFEISPGYNVRSSDFSSRWCGSIEILVREKSSS